jgi:hypothetical protein
MVGYLQLRNKMFVKKTKFVSICTKSSQSVYRLVEIEKIVGGMTPGRVKRLENDKVYG